MHFRIDALQYANWSEKIFRQLREGRLDGIHVTITYHENFRETVLVLEGSQTDDNGHYPTGTLIVNTAGSSHNVWSTDGCVVLVQWAKPIEFAGD